MTSTSASTGANTWLEKKDETYLQEYNPAAESSTEEHQNTMQCLVEQQV